MIKNHLSTSISLLILGLAGTSFAQAPTLPAPAPTSTQAPTSPAQAPTPAPTSSSQAPTPAQAPTPTPTPAPTSSAQAPTPTPAPAPAPAQQRAEIPSFVTLDRGDANSRVEFSAGVSSFENEAAGFNARLDLYGQYTGSSGLGGYLALPLSFIEGDGETSSAVGNIEFGGLYVVPNTNVPVAIRASLVLPTAGQEFDEFTVNLGTALGRFTDQSTSVIPETTWLRLSSSPMTRIGNLFLRLDGGLDVALSTPEDTDVDPVFRLNLGAGITSGCLTFTSELVTVATVGDVRPDEQRFRHTFALSIRKPLSSVELYAALVVPLESQYQSNLGVNTVIVVGLQLPIGR